MQKVMQTENGHDVDEQQLHALILQESTPRIDCVMRHALLHVEFDCGVWID